MSTFARNHTYKLVSATILMAIAATVPSGCSSSKTSSDNQQGTVVHVTITDQGAMNKPMTFTIDRASVPAGDVTFVVANDGKIDHELVVLQTNTAYDAIPVDAAGDPPAAVTAGANKILEDNNVGETGEPNLTKGQARTFTIANMQAGAYVLVCNLAMHYQMGLRAAFTVS